MKNSSFIKLSLIITFAISIGVFLVSEMVYTEPNAAPIGNTGGVYNTAYGVIPPGTIKGFVKEKGTRNMVGGIKVKLIPETEPHIKTIKTKTIRNGYYEFKALTISTGSGARTRYLKYKLEVDETADYEDYSSELTFFEAKDSTITHNIELTKKTVTPPPEEPVEDALSYVIEGLNRSIRLIDRGDSRGDEHFWVEIKDTLTEEILSEHQLELTHRDKTESIKNSTKVLFSHDKTRMVISETSAISSGSIAGFAFTYIVDVEDGSLMLISGGGADSRTWQNTCIDSEGEYLILVNIGDRYSSRSETLPSYMRVYSLENGQLTDSVIVSEEADYYSQTSRNGFVEATYDEDESVMKITRERLHWLNNEMERWNIYYRIEDGTIQCVEDDMYYANRAKADIEEMVEGIEPDPDYGSKLLFISKVNKPEGGYDVILHYYDDEYVASYNSVDVLTKITLPDGTVIVPSEISIELNESIWTFEVSPGGKADNLKYDTYGTVPTHQVKNIGKIPIDIDIRYGEVEGCKAGSVPGKDTFVVMCIDKIIPPEGSVVLYTNVEPNESKGIPLVYYAPTELNIDVSGMSATFEIRAYATKERP